VGPVVATAIHDGHAVRDEAMRHMVLDEPSRLREEDPFTGRWTVVAPTRVVGLRSRFEVDLNRPRETAVYRTPEDAWGLEVWRDAPPDEVIERSLEAYDAFYEELERLYSQFAEEHGRFLVLDLHSYNHRRDGAAGPPADPADNPQVNVGTGTMADRGRWAGLIDRFIEDLAGYDFPGGALDVRENVRFRGGACAAWTHRIFPEAACVLSIEVKKFFMDEWTGEPDEMLVDAIGSALGTAVAGVLEELEQK
jgi:N-formylglutamate amidohydrolase